MIGRILKNKVAKNAGWLVGGHIAQMVISFVVSILTARFLGPGNYGLISYGAAYTAFFTSLSTLGIHSVIVKELINHPDHEGQVLGTAIGLKAISSFLSAMTIVAIVSVVDRNEPTTVLVVAACSLGVVINVIDTFKYWFQSKLRSKITAIAGLIGYLVISSYKVVLIVMQKGVVWFAFSTALDYLCVGVILAVIYKKNEGQKLSFSWKYGKQLLKTSGHFILPSLMVSVYAQTDKMMLKQMMDEAQVGFYATAVALASLWCFILQAVIDSLNPAIMEDRKAMRTKAYVQKNKLLYAIVFYMSVIASVLYCVLAKPMIHILYGEAYLPTVVPLRIITWYTAFSYLGVARNAWVVCENKQKYLIWLYISAAISNVILNFILIPPLGTAGAAIASLAAQIVTVVIAPCFIKPLRPNVRMMVEAITFQGVLPQDNKK